MSEQNSPEPDEHGDNEPVRHTISASRIFWPYFSMGLVINMFLNGRLDVEPFLILVIAFGLAIGIWPLPKWFYPDESISSGRSIMIAFASILAGCVVATLAFPPAEMLSFISAAFICSLAGYAGYKAKLLRDSGMV